jgi:glutamate-1-semialdehyde 2,1-aminomutase
VHYNDLKGAKALFEKYRGQIACFAIEPVPGNMGVILPKQGYLQGLRELCDEHGVLFLFDEVMSGFRVAFGGAQQLSGVKPDLVCLGKVIGGGLPVGAYGGRRDLMEQVSPSGEVYQAGTLSGNPLAMSAGIAMLEILKEPGAYDALEKSSGRLADGLAKAASAAGVPLTINRVGSMLTPFFVRTEGAAVGNFDEAVACDTQAFGKFFNAMLEAGVYLPPSQFEAWFVSLAHGEEDIDATIKVAEKAFAAVHRKVMSDE